jgi:hypothetical protein
MLSSSASARQAAGVPSGEAPAALPPPLHQLAADHGHLRALLSGWHSCSELDEKEAIVHRLVDELESHIGFKQRYVYPLYRSKLEETGAAYLRESQQADAAALEAVRVMRHARGRLAQHGAAVDQAIRTMAEADMVVMQLEESLYFHALARKLSQAELGALAAAFEQERRGTLRGAASSANAASAATANGTAAGEAAPICARKGQPAHGVQAPQPAPAGRAQPGIDSAEATR